VIPNTPIVAIFLPVIQSWCRLRHIIPSRVLIPLSIATITGGTLTPLCQPKQPGDTTPLTPLSQQQQAFQEAIQLLGSG
jgi:hypothetical protein